MWLLYSKGITYPEIYYYQRGLMNRELSPKEKVVLALAARGLTNKEIGDELEITENTVITIMSNAYLKLSARNRAEAVAICLQKHLVENWL